MGAVLTESALKLPREATERLLAYAALLGRWTQRINLVSRADAGQIWERHVLDSLRLLPFIPEGTPRAIDLGSGAGLPGLVLAVATGIRFELVEADRRKAAFLGEAQRVSGAPVTIHCARIEDLALPPAPLVPAPFLMPGGVALFPKGERVAGELAAARREWRLQVREAGTPDRPILVLSGFARV